MQFHPDIGLHAGPGGNHTGLGDWMQTLDSAGIPFFLVSADHYGHIHEAAQLAAASGVPHTLIFRLTKWGQNDGFDYDVPRYDLPPADAAVLHWNRLTAKLPPEFDKERVWLSVFNEPDHERADFLGDVATTIASLALQEGFKVTLFGWSSGEPEPEDWRTPGMRRFLARCAERPDQCAISLHEYNWFERQFPQVYPHEVGRFQWLFQAADELGLRRPTVHIKEFGWAHSSAPSWEGAREYLRQCARLYKMYGIKGSAIWYLGAGFEGIADQVQPLIAPLTEWTLDTHLEMPPDWSPERPYPLDPEYFAPGEPPPPPDRRLGDARVPYNRKYYRVSRQATLDQFLQVAAWAFQEQATVGFSNDDAGIGVGLAKKTVVEVGREYEPEEIDPWYVNQYGVDEIQHRDFPGTPFWDVSIPVILLSQRNPSWRNIKLGQDTNHDKTIGNFGCLLVVYAMWANHHGLANGWLPPAMNDHMVANGCFTGPYLINGALRQAFPDQVEYMGWLPRDDARMAPRIRQWLDRGLTVPARVDFEPATSAYEQHWVLVTGYSDDDWLVADPWTGEQAALSHIYPISGEDVLEALFYEPVADEPEPPPPPPAQGEAGFGLHLSADSRNLPGDMDMLRQARPDVLKVLSSHDPNDVRAVAAAAAGEDWGQKWIIRAFLDFGGRDVSWEQFCEWTIPDVARTVTVIQDYGLEVAGIELHNEPNLVAEGFGFSWSDGYEFASWLGNVWVQYRNRFPAAPLLFPGLSPGPAIAGIRPLGHRNFWTQAAGAADLCDGVAVHSYWSPAYPWREHPDAGVALVREAVERFGYGKPIWVTECSNNSGDVSPGQKVAEYLDFWVACRQWPNVQGLTYFVLSATHDGWQWNGGSGEVWTPNMAGAVIPEVRWAW